MTLIEFMTIFCVLGGAVLGAILGWDLHPLAALGGFFAGGLLGWGIGPVLALLVLALSSLEDLVRRWLRKVLPGCGPRSRQ